MKAGWQNKQIDTLCDVLDYKRQTDYKKGSCARRLSVAYYGATGVLDSTSQDSCSTKPLVLVGEDGAKWESGECTRAAYPVEGKCWVNNHAHVLRPDRTKASGQLARLLSESFGS